MTGEVTLTEAIVALHMRAGAPSTRKIAAAGGDVSHATVADLLRGTRVASWEKTARVIQLLGGDPAGYLELWKTAAGASRKFRRTGRMPTAAVGALVHALNRSQAIIAGLAAGDCSHAEAGQRLVDLWQAAFEKPGNPTA